MHAVIASGLTRFKPQVIHTTNDAIIVTTTLYMVVTIIYKIIKSKAKQ